MSALLVGPRQGFASGLTALTTVEDESGIALSVLKLEAGERVALLSQRETAWLLMSGTLEVSAGTQRAQLSRASLFDEQPGAVHVSAGTQVELKAQGPVELTVYETANTRPFAPRVYLPSSVRDEHRGQGKVNDAAYRLVRTLFDGTTAPPDAELVLGEVVTLPGRWSSYPPHHHPQPELYHYRFDDPRGYGHAELGEQVLKVRHGDTVRILDGHDHPQCAAPGYAMYYAWVIRHLPGARYGTPEFNAEHAWTMADGAKSWWPKEKA